MKIAFRLVLLAAAAGLGFWLWTVLFPSPEKAVLKKISGLARTVTVSASDGNITRATRSTMFIGLFFDRCGNRRGHARTGRPHAVRPRRNP